eukprot:gene13947-18467_t
MNVAAAATPLVVNFQEPKMVEPLVPGHGPVDIATAQKVRDPVCGMTVDPLTSPHHAEHAGEVFHFCSAGCRTKFVAEPLRFLKGEPTPVKAAAGAIYTCPMHPEIRQPGPGSCPICGMALEPELVSADSGPDPELVDMTRRFWIGLALTAPVFFLEMGSHFIDLHRWITPGAKDCVQFDLTSPA